MKILCKKSYNNFKKGELYNALHLERYFTFSAVLPIETAENVKTFFIKGRKRDTNFPIFEEYFYTPEETQNILRTELIDKILQNE